MAFKLDTYVYFKDYPSLRGVIIAIHEDAYWIKTPEGDYDTAREHELEACPAQTILTREELVEKVSQGTLKNMTVLNSDGIHMIGAVAIDPHGHPYIVKDPNVQINS